LQYINGTTVYSPTLQQLGVNSSYGASDGSSNNTSTTYYSAAGEPFTVSYNSSGLFVSNGNSNLPAARVTRPDILVENGVIHLIDRPLFDTQANSDAASSAYVFSSSLFPCSLVDDVHLVVCRYASATSAAAQTSTDTYAIGTAPIPAPAETSNGGGSGGGGGGGLTSSAQEPTQTSSSESAGTSTASANATPSSFRIRRGLRIPL
jgi:hypothetical protein